MKKFYESRTWLSYIPFNMTANLILFPQPTKKGYYT